jgi:hypothetical protein
MFIIERHSNSQSQNGQPTHQWLGACTCVCLLLLIALGGGSGCTSIYHRYRAELPTGPSAELKLRIAETRRANDIAGQAAGLLHNSLQGGLSGEVLQANFDRLESAAFELERRVLAARDSWKRCGEPADRVGEIEELHRRATSWLDYAQANRSANASTRALQLEVLLRALAMP